MKAKKAQIISLLFLAALVGCSNTSDVTSDTGNSNNTSQTTETGTSSSDSKSKPISVSINTERNYLYVNEELSLSAAFEPSNSSDDYRLTSSDPDIISVTGRKIKGVSATTDDEEVTITLTTDAGLTATAKFVVYDAISHVTDLLNTSHTLALKNATGGSLNILSIEEGLDDYNESISYNIYKNSSEVIDEVQEGSSDAVTTIYNRAIIGDSYVESRRKRTGSTGDYNNVNGYLENRTIVDEVTDSYRQYTREEAEERISNVQICSSTSVGTRGMEGFILDQFLTNSSSFGSSNAKSSITMEENLSSLSDIYTLSYDYTKSDSTTRVEEELVLEFAPSGLLIEISDKLNEYEGDDPKLVASYDVNGVQMSGEREDIPEGAFDFSEYFLTDFDVIFHSDMFDYSTESDTTYNVGDTAWLLTSDYSLPHSPSTAITYIDPIKITSVSDPDAVEIIYDSRIKFKKLVSDLEVTVSSTINKVEKKVTLHCVPPATTMIRFGEFVNPDSSFSYYADVTSAHYLPSSWVVGTDREVWVVGEKAQQSPEITVTSSNTDVATVTMVEGSSNKFTFHPIKAGKATIKVVDKTLGEEKAINKEITIYDNSDIGIADLLRESAFTPYNSSLYADFDFSGTSGTNCGDFSGKYAYGSGGIDIWGSWIVEEGEVKVTTYSGAFGEVTYGSSVFVLTDVSFSNYSKYGPTNLTIKGTSQSAGEIGDGFGTGIVLY